MTATITKTERRLLALLERFCFQDGKIYPKRTTIAAKLGIKPRQVSNLVASLVKKGFIAVVPAGLLDRHLYGKGNRYHLLDHPVYGKIAPENAPQNGNPTIYKNKGVKNKSCFDVIAWLEKNTGKHPMAVVDALKELTKRWPSIRFPGHYAKRWLIFNPEL